MNESIAKIHFPEAIDDPAELYSDKLFRFKQFYFQRSPIPKVCQQKVKELRDIHLAFEIRFPYIEIQRSFTPLSEIIFSNDLATDLSILQNLQTVFRARIANSHNALDLAEYLENWYCMECAFAKTYSTLYASEDLSEVNISQNKDPMLLNEYLAEMSFSKISMAENQINKSAFPTLLQEELKRCAKFIELHERII